MKKVYDLVNKKSSSYYNNHKVHCGNCGSDNVEMFEMRNDKESNLFQCHRCGNCFEFAKGGFFDRKKNMKQYG